ncbi:MAG: ATP-binding protein [Infirmifilum sp.]
MSEKGYVGLGEARMIGVFGKSGAGKSWLAAYIIAGFAKNKDMGILILDPQGEFANNFPSSNLPFHQIIRFACGRELTIIRSDEIKLNPDNVYDVALFTKKLFAAKSLFPTSPDKYEEFLSELYEEIIITRQDKQEDAKQEQQLNCINPVACYVEVTKANKDNNLDKAAKILGLSHDKLKESLQKGNKEEELITKIWEKFLASFYPVLNRVFTQETVRRIKSDLDNAKRDKSRIELFKKYLNLFDTSQGVTVDHIVDLLLTQRRVVILDLSKLEDRFPGIDEVELTAFFMSRIIGKIREKAEELFEKSRNNLVNVLIAMDEAHNYVGALGSDLPEDLKQLKRQIVKNVKETRKYGIGWLFITQTTVDFDKEIYRQLHDYFFLYGLGVGADLQHMKEVVPKEFVEHYRSLPNPKLTNNYWAMHAGSLTVLNTATTATFIRLPTPDEFLQLNFGMTLDELRQREKETDQLKSKPVD